MKRLNKKGFTLIEVIVVIAILAILAAMAIPTMNGFIKEAKDNQYIAEARSAYVAAQFVATRDQEGDANPVTDADFYTAVKKIAELPNTATVSGVVIERGAVTKLVYTTEGKQYTWGDGESVKVTDAP